ncbi:M56 family metallopeptidase [Novosphingobium guangzhouense]|uniref:Antirepressor regulating drug resistance protein n=1 Tax=Novosphingobium guangzhouense TaxID=1850347 RepID=A0A2K2FVP5_9SPHN|nr:M56 family metallopeptidase [Novosphingobium guangzhouense]PNU02856.1 antirepressor regulating drug resistance protein [Novosphingobium guangzhouense]
MIEWLTDTLVATGALMALVLLVRRPVARWFGPAAAYALWALPMIRLVLPPLALPSFMAHGFLTNLRVGVEPVTASAAGTQATVPAEALAVVPFVDAAGAPSVAAAEPGLLAQVPWASVALAIWLGGAALFLVWRTVTYRWMRRDLLDGARVVARSSTVRIVETPAITAPLAFGVFDKVVALPQGFLAEADSETSDFAIAHEMEHHAGSDLLALIAMQPLFALHWFNPIGWAGWRAVRADQEAFCDARVMAGRSRAERARYGRLIASMAGGTRLGLAAPMAGPLSGEKPIIQRLKALAAADVSPTRRVLGRSLFALAIVAVPATATVSYAAMDEAGIDEAGIDPVAGSTSAPRTAAVSHPAMLTAPQAPVPPAAPQALAEADLPVPPEAPEFPELPDMDAEQGVVPPIAAVPPVPPLPPVPPVPPVRFTDRDAMTREQARQLHDAQRTAAVAQRRAAEAQRQAQRQAAAAQARAPQVSETVSADGKRRTISMVHRDGSRTSMRTMVLDSDCPAASRRREVRGEGSGASASVVICTGEPEAAKLAAVNALRSVRATFAADRALDAKVRAEILAGLDGEIADAHREMNAN